MTHSFWYNDVYNDIHCMKGGSMSYYKHLTQF